MNKTEIKKKNALREIANSLPLEDWQIALRKLIYSKTECDKTTAICNLEFIISFLKNKEA